MRVVAAQAIDPLQIAIEMLRTQGLTRPMAVETQGAPLPLQQPIILPGVGAVAGAAVALLKRLMADLEALLRVLVAAVAQLSPGGFQQAGFSRGMGGMTGAAQALFNRLMRNRAGSHPIGHLLMAGVAERLFFFQQQPCVPGNMRAVTTVALLPGNRRMIDLSTELGGLMAPEAVHRQGTSRQAEDPEQNQARDEF